MARPPTNHSSQEVSVIVALMEQVEGLRGDIAKQTETISNKLDSQTRETRSEFKELREDISEIKARLASGSEQIRTLRKDVDVQRSKCDTHCVGHASALVRKQDDTEPYPSKKLKWYHVALITGILTYAGPIIFTKSVAWLNNTFNPPAVGPVKS